jgi:hypothetical protein
VWSSATQNYFNGGKSEINRERMSGIKCQKQKGSNGVLSSARSIVRLFGTTVAQKLISRIETTKPTPLPRITFEDVIESNYYSSGEDEDKE